MAFCMRRVITGTATFNNQTNRDAAYSRMNTALVGVSYTPFSSTIGNGITQPTTTTIIISIEVPDVDTGIDTANSIYDAWTSNSNARNSSGFLSVNRF